jgi:hypothetical protein
MVALLILLSVMGSRLEPKGACCDADKCTITVQSTCTTGPWYEGMPCKPFPCPQPTRACCFADGSCQSLTEAECPGLWLGWALCDPNPCPAPHDGVES